MDETTEGYTPEYPINTILHDLRLRKLGQKRVKTAFDEYNALLSHFLEFQNEFSVQFHKYLYEITPRTKLTLADVKANISGTAPNLFSILRYTYQRHYTDIAQGLAEFDVLVKLYLYYKSLLKSIKEQRERQYQQTKRPSYVAAISTVKTTSKDRQPKRDDTPAPQPPRTQRRKSSLFQKIVEIENAKSQNLFESQADKRASEKLEHAVTNQSIRETQQHLIGESPQQSNNETPQNPSLESPRQSNGETPRLSNQDSPQQRISETPGLRNRESTQQSKDGTPRFSNPDTPQQSKGQTSRLPNQGTPRLSNSETPRQLNRGTPGLPNRESPHQLNRETPKPSNREQLIRETPKNSNREQLSRDTPRQSNTRNSQNSKRESPKQFNRDTSRPPNVKTPTVPSQIETSKLPTENNDMNPINDMSDERFDAGPISVARMPTETKHPNSPEDREQMAFNPEKDKPSTVVNDHQVQEQLSNGNEYDITQKVPDIPDGAHTKQGGPEARPSSTELKLDELEDLRKKYSVLVRENDSQKAEIDELTTRLSQLVSQQMTNANPSIQDLSDKNRPLKIGEMFAAFYDNEWTDAYEGLQSIYRTDRDILLMLRGFLSSAYGFCQEAAASLLNKLEDSMEDIVRCPAVKLEGHNEASKSDDVSGMENLVTKAAKDYLKTCGTFSIDGLCTIFRKHSIVKSLPNTDEESMRKILKFVERAVELTWLMNIQDPPMVLKFARNGDTINTDIYSYYEKDGDLIDICVWPALFFSENGDLLQKGHVLPI